MGIYTKAFLEAFKPKSILTVSEWADKNRVLTSETSAVPGRWRTDMTPYLREPMDTCASPDYNHIVLMFASQLGKSEAINNVAGFYIDQEPSPQMLIQPTLLTAKEYSQIRIGPMIKACPTLSEKVIDEDQTTRKKDKPNMFYKPYPGGYLVLSGANSAPSLASKPIRILLRDEIDRFPDVIPGEGSPLDLSEQRARTFFNKRIVDSSTPLIAGESKIETMFLKSDQRHYFVPCPHCEHSQELTWEHVKFDPDGTDLERSKTARIECENCGEIMKGSGRADSAWIGQGVWRRTAVSDIAGFYLNALYSPLITLSEMVRTFLEAVHLRDEDKKQTFYNLILGLPYEKNLQDAKDYEEIFEKRRQYYDATIPDQACLLTAGVDVQDDRIEAEIVGWGLGFESWGIEYRVFMGKPDNPKLWNDLDEWLLQPRQFREGGELPISATCVDSGGHYTTEVYNYTKPRESRRVFAIKGHSRDNSPYISKPSKVGRVNATLFNIYTPAGKSKIWTRIHEEAEGPGYCHFPREDERGYDLEYFKGLLSEKYIKKTGSNKGEWVKIRRRNEPFDIRNYAQVALELIVPNAETMVTIDKQVNRSGGTRTQQNPQQKRRARGVLSKGIQN